MQPLSNRLAAAAEALSRWGNLEECLLQEVAFWNWTYSLDLVFNYVWEDGGTVRDAVSDPRFVTVRLTGVEQVTFDGALSDAQKRHPERINWGMSEVAVVSLAARGEFVQLSALWEGKRRLVVAAVDIEVIEGRAPRD